MGNSNSPSALCLKPTSDNAAAWTPADLAQHLVDWSMAGGESQGASTDWAAPAGGNSSADELAKAVCADQPERFVITPAASSPTDHICWQGTSFAAPLVSGAAALLFGAGMMDVTQALQ